MNPCFRVEHGWLMRCRGSRLGNVLVVWKDTRLISRAESVSTILSLALVGVMVAVWILDGWVLVGKWRGGCP